MEVAERIRSRGATSTSAERRVAEAILAAPQAVGFGTVAWNENGSLTDGRSA